MYDSEIATIRERVGKGDHAGALAEARKVYRAMHESHRRDDTVWDTLHTLTCVPVRLGDTVVQAEVVNELTTDYGEKIYLIQIGCGISGFYFAVSARTEQDALDAYANNDTTCLLTLVQNGDMDEADCVLLGNAGEPHYFESLHIDVLVKPEGSDTYVVRSTAA